MQSTINANSGNAVTVPKSVNPFTVIEAHLSTFRKAVNNNLHNGEKRWTRKHGFRPLIWPSPFHITQPARKRLRTLSRLRTLFMNGFPGCQDRTFPAGIALMPPSRFTPAWGLKLWISSSRAPLFSSVCLLASLARKILPEINQNLGNNLKSIGLALFGGFPCTADFDSKFFDRFRRIHRNFLSVMVSENRHCNRWGLPLGVPATIHGEK